MSSDKQNETQPQAEEAFVFFASLPSEKRSYAAVAERFQVNLTTVKRWGTKGNWRRRLQERELRIARRAADQLETVEVSARARQLKMLELALVKLVNGIAEGAVRGSYGDLERLLRLEGFLKGTDKSIPADEVRKLFEYFLQAIEREIDDPEQRKRIAAAIREAIDTAQTAG